MPQTLKIDHIGSAGDGLTADSTPVPRTLPNETITAEPGKRPRLLEILTPSPDRVQPPCPHFIQGCGGCALQHWADAPYAAWKRGLVTAALQRAGYEAPNIAPLVRTAPATRRRMEFAAERVDGAVRFGLHEAHTKTIIDLATCPILDPALSALIAPLRDLLRGLAALRHRGSILANRLADGADLLLRTDGPLAPTDRAKLAAFATAHAIRRIAWTQHGAQHGTQNDGPIEIAAQLAAPHVTFAGIRVEPPPGAFLQASTTGEAAIVAAVLAAIPAKRTGRARAIELYAGCGTISFPLAAHLRVQAYEGDPQAAACVRRAQTGTHLEMTQRDLARQPLSAKELAPAALIVLDPPYAGAPAQIAQIAASKVARIAYVSCNPGALSRDAAMLRQAGYRLLSATPIDQFLWSAQVECVAVFALE